MAFKTGDLVICSSSPSFILGVVAREHKYSALGEDKLCTVIISPVDAADTDRHIMFNKYLIKIL